MNLFNGKVKIYKKIEKRNLAQQILSDKPLTLLRLSFQLIKLTIIHKNKVSNLYTNLGSKA